MVEAEAPTELWCLLTTRLYIDGSIASASLSFNVSTTGGVDEFWNAVGLFTSHLQSLIVDNGMAAAYEVANSSLSLFSLMAPAHNSSELETLMEPMVSALQEIVTGTLDITISGSNSYYKQYSTTLESLIAPNPLSPVLGGRFVSRDNTAKNLSAVVKSMRTATASGNFYLAITALSTNSSVRVSTSVTENSVNPAWNDAFLSIIIGAFWDFEQPWDRAIALQSELTNAIMPNLEAATPGAGAYLNEANWEQNDWQQIFYGASYSELKRIKNTYDPFDVFYGLTAVGSESWAVDANGRLCRTGL